MKTFVILNFMLFFHIGHGLEKLHASKVRRELAGIVPDAGKVLESFTSLVLVSDPVNGTGLDCFQVCQTDFNEGLDTATYSWILPKLGQTLDIEVQAEDSAGAFTFIVGDDSTVMSGRYHYSDYITCLVLDFDYHGHQCVLLATPSFKDNVRQPCVDHFLRTCGSSAKLLSKDHCKAIECDNE